MIFNIKRIRYDLFIFIIFLLCIIGPIIISYYYKLIEKNCPKTNDCFKRYYNIGLGYTIITVLVLMGILYYIYVILNNLNTYSKENLNLKIRIMDLFKPFVFLFFIYILSMISSGMISMGIFKELNMLDNKTDIDIYREDILTLKIVGSLLLIPLMLYFYFLTYLIL